MTYGNLDYLRYRMFVEQNRRGGVFASSAVLGSHPGGGYERPGACCRNSARTDTENAHIDVQVHVFTEKNRYHSGNLMCIPLMVI